MPFEENPVAMSVAGDRPIHHVSVKPPPFMETAVKGWFAILDAQFHLARITSDETKFYHVLSSLPPDTIAHLPQEILIRKNFGSLQEAVTDMYEKTKPELFERLISKARLTGRPSLFLSELREIADKVGVGDDLIRHKFVQSLPTGIAAALASQRELSLSQLGKLADELLPLVQGSQASVNMTAGVPESQRDLDAGMYQPTEPYRPVPCYSVPPQTGFSRAGPRRYPAHSRGAPAGAGSDFLGLTPYHDGQRPQVCRSHLFYGARARNCKPWCRWPTKAADLKVEPSSRPASPSRAPPSGN